MKLSQWILPQKVLVCFLPFICLTSRLSGVVIMRLASYVDKSQLIYPTRIFNTSIEAKKILPNYNWTDEPGKVCPFHMFIAIHPFSSLKSFSPVANKQILTVALLFDTLVPNRSISSISSRKPYVVRSLFSKTFHKDSP